MKMKKACEATALTERAIRLYISRRLITPDQINGILEFSGRDIQRLKDIAVLRQMDFSIEQIFDMIHQPSTIADIIAERLVNAQTDMEHHHEVHAILMEIQGEPGDDLHSIAMKIRKRCVDFPTVNFGRFDEISEDVRQQEEDIALVQLANREKRSRCIRNLGVMACVVAVIGLIVVVFLTQPRVQGYIPIGSFTIAELSSDTISVVLSDEKIIELLGQKNITVPYHAYRVPLGVGDVIDGGCQLAIDLSNFDLLRMGIHPLQTISTRSEEINREWTKLIVQTLFKRPIRDEAALWIREYNPDQFKPLFWWENNQNNMP